MIYSCCYFYYDKVLIRNISCWTISRYSSWIVNQLIEGNHELFENVVLCLLERIGDSSKQVQQVISHLKKFFWGGIVSPFQQWLSAL